MKNTFTKMMVTGLISGALSAIINSVIFFIFHWSGIISDEFVVAPNNRPVDLSHVVTSSVYPCLLAGLAFFIIGKLAKNSYQIFLTLALLLLVLSFINPFVSIPNVPVSMAVALFAMHIVVVVILLVSFRRYDGKNPATD